MFPFASLGGFLGLKRRSGMVSLNSLIARKCSLSAAPGWQQQRLEARCMEMPRPFGKGNKQRWMINGTCSTNVGLFQPTESAPARCIASWPSIVCNGHPPIGMTDWPPACSQNGGPVPAHYLGTQRTGIGNCDRVSRWLSVLQCLIGFVSVHADPSGPGGTSATMQT